MIFSYSYNKILEWSEKKTAAYYLAGLSFFESFILPYPPPDVLLAPLALKNTDKAYRLAFITTVASVIGGVVGYAIGALLYEPIIPLLEKMNYMGKLNTLSDWFDKYGIWTVAIAGFSPVPYKLFTFLSGLLGLALLPFIAMSAISRGLRFFLVALFVKKMGKQCDTLLKKYIDIIGYSVLLLAIIIYFLV